MLLRSTTQLLIMEILWYVVIMWYSGGGLLCKFFFADFRLNYVICAHLGQPSSIKVGQAHSATDERVLHPS